VAVALTRRTAGAEAARERGEQSLLDATVRLLDGPTPFSDISISEITTAAGFSRATFYAYFSDKRELLLRLGGRLVDDLYAQASAWLEGEAGDVRPTLVALLDVFRRHRPTLLALNEAATYDEEVAEFWRGIHDTFGANAHERIRREQPDISDEQVASLAFVLVWMTERCLTEHLTAPRVDDDALLDALVHVWTGIARGLPPSAARS
jgi:TetR/AcrR family transcriptional regulator, ethionamide resistance regulator